MYNEVLADNSAMIQGGANTSNDLPSLEKDPILNRIRKVLIVLIGINFVSKSNENRFKNIIWFLYIQVLSLTNFLFVIHSYAATESLESQSPNSSSQLVSVIISLIFYGFGLLVAYRYYQTGLLIVSTMNFYFLNWIIDF
jgi:hypothetical protein